MRHVRRLGLASLFLLLVCGRAAGADDALAKAKAEELKKLQGTWLIVSGEVLGKKADEQLKGTNLVVMGAKLTIFFGDYQYGTQEFELDPTRDPKHMNWKHEKGVTKGIYSLDGDRFTICLYTEAKQPDDFKPTETNIVMLFKRK